LRREKLVMLLVASCVIGFLALAEVNEYTEAKNAENTDAIEKIEFHNFHETLLTITQAIKELKKYTEENQEQQKRLIVLQKELDTLSNDIKKIESGQASVKDALSSVSSRFQQELEGLKNSSEELSADVSQVKENQTNVQNEFSDLSSDLEKLQSTFKAKVISLESELAFARKLIVYLLILFFVILLTVFVTLILHQFRKNSQNLAKIVEGLQQATGKLKDELVEKSRQNIDRLEDELLERLQPAMDKLSAAQTFSDEDGQPPSQHSVISEYQPPSCASAPMMITITTKVLDQLQEKTSIAEQKRPGDEVGFGLVGYVVGNWEQLYISGLLNPGKKARYSPGSVHEDLKAQANELKRYQFLNPQVGYLGFAHRHPGAMEKPSEGDRKTDITNVVDAFKENGKGGFVYAILIKEENGNGWDIFWYYMPREEIEYFPFTPRVVEAPALPKAWNSKLEYRVQAEMSCLRECAEILSLETLEREETSYLSILLVAKRWNGTSLLFVIHEDYPFLPPAVYLQRQQGKVEKYQSQLIEKWQPTYSLANIVFEFDDKIA